MGGSVARASYKPKGSRELRTCDGARRTHYGRGVGCHAMEGALHLVQQAGPEMRAARYVHNSSTCTPARRRTAATYGCSSSRTPRLPPNRCLRRDAGKGLPVSA